MNSKSKSLAYIQNNEPNGELKVKALVTLLITETLEFFSVTNSMSDTQIGITVNLIMDEFLQYKSDFFILCFDNAKKFKYGKNYNRIDGQIIFEWLTLCDEDLTAEAVNKNIREHKKINSDVVHIGDFSTIPEDPKDRPVPMPENVKELYKSIGKKLPEKPKEEKPLDPKQEMVKGFVLDFDNLTTDDGAIRFVFVDGKHMDIKQYVDYRILKYEEAEHEKYIEQINFYKPTASLTQRGANESIYECRINGVVFSFYIEHEEAKSFGVHLTDKMEAIELLPFQFIIK